MVYYYYLTKIKLVENAFFNRLLLFNFLYFRLEDQLYLEQVGMLRPPMFPPLTASYPLYGLRYTPEMAMAANPLGLISPAMHER